MHSGNKGKLKKCYVQQYFRAVLLSGGKCLPVREKKTPTSLSEKENLRNKSITTTGKGIKPDSLHSSRKRVNRNTKNGMFFFLPRQNYYWGKWFAVRSLRWGEEKGTIISGGERGPLLYYPTAAGEGRCCSLLMM